MEKMPYVLINLHLFTISQFIYLFVYQSKSREEILCETGASGLCWETKQQ